MRAAGRLGRTVILRLRFDDSSRATRSHTLPYATANTQTILTAARELLAAAVPLIQREGITLVGISVTNLADGRGQLRLVFDEEWAEELDIAVDEVRDRFGSASARPGGASRPEQGVHSSAASGLGLPIERMFALIDGCSSHSMHSTGLSRYSRSGDRSPAVEAARALFATRRSPRASPAR